MINGAPQIYKGNASAPAYKNQQPTNKSLIDTSVVLQSGQNDAFSQGNQIKRPKDRNVIKDTQGEL